MDKGLKLIVFAFFCVLAFLAWSMVIEPFVRTIGMMPVNALMSLGH